MAIERQHRVDRWGDEDDEEGGSAAAARAVDGRPTPRWRALTRDEAAVLRQREPAVSPWRVVAAQAVLGVAAASVAALAWGSADIGWSLLYGAGVVVLPGALMARGMTSRFTSMSPGVSAVSFMSWEAVKIGVSIAMLMLAPKLVQPLSWPALLAGLVLCMKVYWLALLWRGREKN